MNSYCDNSILLSEVQRYSCASTPIAFDIETTGLHPHLGSKVFSVSFTNEDHKTAIYRIDKADRFTNYKKAKQILESPIPIVGHNILFDLSFMPKTLIQVPEDKIIHDTMRMHQLLRNDFKRHSLDYLSYVYGGFSRDLDSKIKKLGDKFGGFHKIPVELMNEYQQLDTHRTMLLFQLLYPEIQKESELFKLYVNEMLIIKAAIDMQAHGLQTSYENLNDLIDTINTEIQDIQDEINKRTGKYYDINKPDVCRYLIYDLLKIPVRRYTEKSKLPSTDKEELLHFRTKYYIDRGKPNRYKTLDLIVKYRSYKHGIQEVTKYKELLDDNRVLHTSLKPCTAATGRWGAQNPNLLNVQKEKVSDIMPYPIPARRCFIPPPGRFIVLPDYSGEELRLIAEVTKEKSMLDIFARDGDPHTEVAEFLFGERFLNGDEQACSGMRAIAKQFNFALAYGASDFKLSGSLQIPLKEIKSLRGKYAEKFPKIAVYSQSISGQVQRDGYIITPFGRRLYVNQAKAFQGGNYLIQGTGVDILKYSIVRLREYIKHNWNNEIKLVLPIHDELIMSMPDWMWDHRDQWKSEISKIMTTFDEICVKLVVGWKYTKNSWNKCTDF